MFGAHVWRRDPPCAQHRNKEYLLNSPLTIESSAPAFHSIILYSDATSCVSICARCLLSCHWTPLSRLWCSFLLFPLSAIRHLLFSGLNCSRSLSLPLYVRYLNPLIICTVLHWTHSRSSISLLDWEAQNWTQHYFVNLCGLLTVTFLSFMCLEMVSRIICPIFASGIEVRLTNQPVVY